MRTSVEKIDNSFFLSTMDHNYKLALKQFINKNFEASFKLTSELFHICFNEYANHTISQTLVTKIINLYLVEVGVCVKDGLLNQVQTNAAINSITSNEVLNQIRSVFGNDIPCEILYNYHLAHITNPKVLIGDGYFDQLHKDYLGANNDKYKPKFMQLVVFEILPTFGKYQEAERLITDPKDLEKLRKIQHLHEEQRAQQRLAKQNQEKERAAALEQAKQQTLKYKSIKEIQNSYEEEHHDVQISQLSYIYNLVKTYLRENYLAVLVVLVLGISANRYRTQLKEKIVETIKMAFKFSYI